MITTTLDPHSRSKMASHCVALLKEKFPNYSSSQIASNVGISQPTFNRIENSSISSPSLNTLISLMNAAEVKQNSISDIIKQIDDESMKESILSQFSHNIETPILTNSFSEYFSIRKYQQIILLALTTSGTTFEEIKYEFGNQGLRDLELLLDKKILIKEDNKIITEPGKVSFAQEILKNTLLNCIENNYDSTQFGSGQNWLSFQTESIDKTKAMPKVLEILRAAYTKVKEEVLYSPEYSGSDKVFIGMVTDLLTTKNNEGEQK
ncbi:MAG: transcriptional regulator with XRE-family HTH domain [Bacteriovoracaceae bacterium]|jgi:transcriptional regulator with XRE-family HTH domain